MPEEIITQEQATTPPADPTQLILRAFPIKLPGTHCPEVKDKEILLIAEVSNHLSHLVEVRSLNPNYQTDGNVLLENDKPEQLNIYYCSVQVEESPAAKEEMGKVIEEAAKRYFNRMSQDAST